MWIVSFVGALILAIVVETVMLISYMDVNRRLENTLDKTMPVIEELKSAQDEQFKKIDDIFNLRCASTTKATTTDEKTK